MHHECNADAVDRESVDEVGGAVERVDDPDKTLVASLALPPARLFSPDAVIWVGCQQRFDDGVFGRFVDFGDEVVRLFGGHPHRLDVEGSAVDDGASGACSLDGHVEHGVQVGGGHGLCEEQGQAAAMTATIIGFYPSCCLPALS
jgi:hypothetical protein